MIETTTYIDPEYVGGHHLVYLPKYTAPGSPLQGKTDDEIREIWIEYLEEMFPEFERPWIRYFLVHREKFVEPLHGIGETDLIPGIEDSHEKSLSGNNIPDLPNSNEWRIWLPDMLTRLQKLSWAIIHAAINYRSYGIQRELGVLGRALPTQAPPSPTNSVILK